LAAPKIGRQLSPLLLPTASLGLESNASDFNPVAIAINKPMSKIPPKFAGELGARASRVHKSWHTRVYLPHCDEPGRIQSITFRLNDSLPKELLQRLIEETKNSREPHDSQVDSHARRQRLEALLAAGHGACWLGQPEIAKLVEDALRHFDGQRYRLLAWCVMPNHVHVLIGTLEGFPLGDVVQSWKSFTAQAINRQLGREGVVWYPDYFDRFIRDDRHLRAVVDYIESNPVAAGLVERAESWSFSSAAEKWANARETRALLACQDDLPSIG